MEAKFVALLKMWRDISMSSTERTYITDEELNSYIYALGVVDMSTMDENKDVDILHAALYASPPGDIDKTHLLEEIKNDKTFGLTEIAHRLTVVELPDYYVTSMIKDAKEESESIELHGDKDE